MINSIVKRWLTAIFLLVVLLSAIVYASAEILTVIITVIIIGGAVSYTHLTLPTNREV